MTHKPLPPQRPSRRPHPVGGLVPGQGRPYAEGTQRMIDEEVIRLLREAEQRALGVLRADRAALERLARRLMEVESLEGTEVYDILGLSTGDGTQGDSQPEKARPIG